MRDVQEYALKAMEMLDAIGIKYGNVTEVTVNYRAKRWGLCTHYLLTDTYKIQINHNLVEAESGEEGLMNTMLHKLLHAAAPGDHHGGMWRIYAEQVRRAYGYNIKRCSSEEEKGIADYMAEQRAAESNERRGKRYQTYCPKCDKVLNSRERLCKYTRDVVRGFSRCRLCQTTAVLRDTVTGEIYTDVRNYVSAADNFSSPQ